MTLGRPRASVTVDGRTLTSAEGALMRVRVSLGFGPAHDAAELTFWPSTKYSNVTATAPLVVALGDDGAEEDVFTGTVVDVRASAYAFVLDGLANTAALANARSSQTFADQSVSDILQGLVQGQSVDVDEVSGDANLSAYSVDDRRTVWSHVLELASLVGADVSATADGKLRVVPPRTGTADHTLHYGADVLAWSGGSCTPPVATAVAAYGAASEDGADNWHWILRSPNAAGSGAVNVVPAFRNKDAAEALSTALTSRANRAGVAAKVTIVGAPKIRPGDLVDVTDLPSGDLGTLRVLGVEHVLDSQTGFVTTLTAEGAE